MKKRGKRSQITIFIIIAIVVVAAALFIIFYPRIKMTISPMTPSDYANDCIAKELDSVVKEIASHGGSLTPENTISYQGKEIEYLCYTSEYYKTCVMQVAFLKNHVEEEISKVISPVAERCVNEMVSSYEDKGYSVNMKKGNISVEIVPHAVKVIVNYDITLEKGSVQNYGKFVVAKNSEMYDSLIIAQSILSWEATYGDSAPETFMMYYPSLKIEKLKQSDGSKIYIITNQETKEEVIFATRSLSWPAGYGADEPFVK